MPLSKALDARNHWIPGLGRFSFPPKISEKVSNNFQLHAPKKPIHGLEQAKARGKKSWPWWLMIHSTNVHLDAMLKVSQFNFLQLLDQRLPLAA
jgi:hypothetical protein